MGERILAAMLFVVALIVWRASQVSSHELDHRYKEGDQIPLYANKVRPFHNPSETYRYYDLGYCLPDNVKEKRLSLGELLNGDRLVSAPYQLEFLREKHSESVCKKKLSKKEVARFRAAVREDFLFDMHFDDLSVLGYVGSVDMEHSKHRYYLYRHIRFDISYNKDRVIGILAIMYANDVVDLTEDEEVDVEFLYTVNWEKTNTPFEKRMDQYYELPSLRRHLEIHRHSESAEAQEETGWKCIHGDVFRHPKYKSLFAACLGSGTQLLTLTVFIFVLAVVGVFYRYNRGALLTALIVIYALTSGIAGYTATYFYSKLGGTNWFRNLLLTGCLFCGPLFLTFCFLNTVAVAYTAAAALPLGTIFVIVLIWTLVSYPLLILGGIVGKNSKAEFQAPCRTTEYPREIPPLRWYRRTITQMAMAGFLPFSVICTELYYIFASVWNYRSYTGYGFLFIVFIILLMVTGFITVGLTHFQLAAEDHKWWWRYAPLSYPVPQPLPYP
ncbi:unnamed protein product [Dovyalis caffra]|uniref:Transmembrane 9 superfamily member n=1 Tax=Dovyalis caffra TaxID=77055 RepID=A0AAV1R1S1_9ROSI|nr:unnamed protein product [Dovyalis caffra]